MAHGFEAGETAETGRVMDQRPVIRIFISSPSDVRPERLKAEQVIAKLDREFGYHFRVKPLLWEREPLVATRHFQDAGNIPEPHRSDIVVVILWTRLGVPLPEDRFRGALSGAAVTGTEWEFEDALAGARKTGMPDLLLYRKDLPLTADLTDRTLLQERLAQLDLVERFIGRWFRSEDGRGFTAASHVFSNTTEFEDKLYDHLRSLLQRRAGAEAGGIEIRWHGPPFRGLASFEPEHAPVFFGRTRARNELRERLARRDAQRQAFLLVLGASGSGKSSLVKAGLLPDLRLPGMIGRVALLRHAVIRPSEQAGDPVAGLAAAMMSAEALPELAGLRYSADRLAELLRSAPDQAALPVEQGLAEASRRADLSGQAEARLLIVVDQLEELWTLDSIDDELRRRFADALDGLCRTGAVWVLATLRSDFYDRLETVPRLARLGEGEGCYRLLPPDAGELAQIVRQPAREAGLRFGFDAGRGVALDDVILDAAARDRGALPLLSFLLDQLWQRRSPEGELTVESYAALGGLEGALGRHAEAVMATLPEARQAALPRLLRALVVLGEGETATVAARPAALDRFPEGSEERALAETFLHPVARLLVAEDAETPGGGARVRVAHEALLSHWSRARDWIAERPADLQLEDRLEAAAARWSTAAPDIRPSLLLGPGLPLGEALDLLGRHRDELSDGAVAFIDASQATEEERRARERRRLAAEEALKREAAEAEAARARQEATSARRIAARTRLGLAVACVLMLAAAGFAWLSVQRAAEAKAATAVALDHLHNAQLQQSRLVAEHASQELAAGYPDAAGLEARAALPTDVAAPDKPFDVGAFSVLSEARAQDRTLALLPHGNFVNGVALSPDGHWAITASRDCTAAIWDAETGVPRITLAGHDGDVVEANFDPTGRKIVTASRDGTARIWDAGSGTLEAVLHGHTGQLEAASFSLDGTRVVTAANDDTARIWDVATGRQLQVLTGHAAWVLAASFSPDGTLVATASADGTARIWDAATGSQRRLLQIDKGQPDGQGWVAVARFSPDGSTLLTAGSDRDHSPRLWDVATGDLRLALHGHTGSVGAARFSPDGQRVATAATDGTARLWDAATGRQIASLPHTGSVTAVAWSADGTRIVTGSTNNIAIVWDAATGARRAFLFGHHGTVTGAVFTPDGRRVITAGGDGAGRLWRAGDDETAVLRQPGGTVIEHAVWSPDSRFVAAGSNEGTISVWDAVSGGLVHRLAGHAARVAALAWRADGRALASGSDDGTARIWNVAHGTEPVVLMGHAGPLTSIAFAPDGASVLTASRDGTARIWDAVSGTERLPLRGHAKGLEAALFSPDGGRVATASVDGTARLWDVATGETLRVFKEHGAAVRDIAFSPDGTRLLTASDDGTARVWTASSDAALLVLDAHRGPVTSAVWSPVGNRILTSTRDSTSALWDAGDGHPVGAIVGDHAVWSPDGAQIATTLSSTSQRVLTAGDRSLNLFDATTGHVVAVYLGHSNSLTGVSFSPDRQRLSSSSWDGTVRIWPVWRLGEADTVAYADLTALRRLTPGERRSLFLDEVRPAARQVPSDPEQACDALAAADVDPNRQGPSVPFSDLDAERAIPTCRKAVEAKPGEPRFAYQLGRALQRSGAFAAAREAYQTAADHGSAPAAYGLAILDKFGLGQPANPQEAQRLFRVADAGGVIAADFYLGQLLLAGFGAARDPAEAIRWFERGAAHGDAPAHWALGQLDEAGQDVPHDLEAALRHYIEADRLIRAAGALHDLDVTARLGATARALAPERVIAIAHEARWIPAPAF